MGGSATDLGLVLAARQAVSATFLLAGGVLSDRLPRNLVLVGASLVQGGAQAVTAALVLSGRASVEALVGLQALYGLGNGLVIPAEVVPQTVSPERFQQANALQGSRVASSAYSARRSAARSLSPAALASRSRSTRFRSASAPP